MAGGYEPTNLQRTVSACLEYLAAATNPSPLAQLAREALMRELNQLQISIGRGLHLVAKRERSSPLFDDPEATVDTAPQVTHTWSAKALSEAIALLPDDLFAGHHVDRVASQIARTEHVGVSLLRALEANGVVEPVGVNHQGDEDPRGPFLRFRKV